MKLKQLPLALVITVLIISCATNPFTKQKTIAFPGTENNKLFPMAFAQYNQVLTENKVLTETKDAQMITRVGQRIAIAAERWLNANGYEGYLKAYKWEYKLIESKEVNAWCMPGGKIAFYTGILPIAKHETGIAAIMGHEVAHALANHGQQRMSDAYIQHGLSMVGNAALAKDEKALSIFNQSFGIGYGLVRALPFSRSHETEADKIGLYLMAIAGYNPDEAAELWKRMQTHSGGQTPPEFLSTHPSNTTRIVNLQALAPKAKAEAEKYGVTSFRPIN